MAAEFGSGVICPCGHSPLMCRCHYVPGSRGHVLVLTTEQHKEWKRKRNLLRAKRCPSKRRKRR